jgi:hypothetical protein
VALAKTPCHRPAYLLRGLSERECPWDLLLL